jgi:hypothetical protein
MKLLDLSPLSVGPAGGPALPGISSLIGGEWVHGSGSLQNCRVDPQSTVLDVWENLSLDPLVTGRGMRHRADLAVAQLNTLSLDTGCEWCVAVPMTWSRPVVQLFLGVARECGLTIGGLFPRALAAAALTCPGEEEVRVLEWGWKHLMCGTVRLKEGEWRLSDVVTLPEGGVIPSFRRESGVAAREMLEQHRVDPLYSGTTEQELFDSWWDWHTGASSDWGSTTGSLRVVHSEEQKRFYPLHHALLEAQGIANTPAVVGPPPLCHLVGFDRWTAEVSDLSGACSLLNLEEGKGPRWRDGLQESGAEDGNVPRVTHVVIDGMAEKAPEGLQAAPGEKVKLPDGREAIAIVVPGSA